MEIIDLNDYEEKRYKTAIALGNFDGIHIGHQYLIQDTVEKAKDRNLKSSILLFKNHTKTILNDPQDPKLGIITSNDQKIDILKELGIEIVYTIDFDDNIMKLTGKDFVDNIIIKKLNSKLVTIGFDYRFGHKALGDSKYLQELGNARGFDVNIVEPIYVNGQLVSSTLIRNLIHSGNIRKANEYLGRHYALLGAVIKGKNRGSKMGYPTANIRLNHNYIIPKTGVYETMTILEDRQYRSLTNIGYNPTFNEDELKIENYILDFNDNIYDKVIKVKFINFIRDDIKFNTTEELIDQIEKDVESIKKHE